MMADEDPSKNKPRLKPDRSALLVTKDETYHHNLSMVAEKVSRLTNLYSQQAYIFLRRFANDEANGEIRGINVKIARELGLKKYTSYIPMSLRNVYKTCPEPEKVRRKAQRKDFKSSVLSKAHQAVLTLMFIKTINPDVDLEKIKEECAEIFDHYLPDISMIANGELQIVDSEDDEEGK